MKGPQEDVSEMDSMDCVGITVGCSETKGLTNLYLRAIIGRRLKARKSAITVVASARSGIGRIRIPGLSQERKASNPPWARPFH